MGNNESIPFIIDETDISKYSHFPLDDVKGWLTTFKNKYNNKITIKDLENIFNSLFPFGDSELFAKNLFKTMNISNSQFLGFDEIMIVYSILAKGSQFERLRWIFRFYDTDNDGFISRNEMFSVIKSIEVMISFFYDEEIDTESLVNEFFDVVGNKGEFISFEDFRKLVEVKSVNFFNIF
ncbi:Neuronal calcium sensor 1 [Dictyocoela muelleri]|nr:Neuronal calcium sensor 1 [Dictyocoela muelleri]